MCTAWPDAPNGHGANVGHGTWFSTAEAEQASDGLLIGNPGSPGTVKGLARIVMGEQDFAKIRPGDIIVSPITTPAWTMLYSTTAAVVTDGGGVLSHAAIVAREHGIPAVIGTKNGTSTLRDGQEIEVDGTAGRVRFS